MNTLTIVIAVVAFITIFIILYLMNVSKINNIKEGKKKKNKDIKIMEVLYLSYKYKIVKERLYKNWFMLLFSFIDSLIICITFLVISLIPWAFVFQMLVGFVLLIGLIYSIYGIMGRILVKRGYQDEL